MQKLPLNTEMLWESKSSSSKENKRAKRNDTVHLKQTLNQSSAA